MCQKMRGIVGIAALAVLLAPGAATAQMLGVGPRVSLVRGDATTSTPTNRFFGGTMRLKLSGFMSLEAAGDYRTTWNTGRTQRIREVPLQGSLG